MISGGYGEPHDICFRIFLPKTSIMPARPVCREGQKAEYGIERPDWSCTFSIVTATCVDDSQDSSKQLGKIVSGKK